MSKGFEALKKLYEEREFTYAESVNHKSSKWKNDIEHYDNIGKCLLTIEEELKALEIIRKCFYVAKSSGAILLTSYGFEHKEELKEVLI